MGQSTAARFGCCVIDNPRVELVSAKLIGLKEATGDYKHVDSDEVLVSPEALNARRCSRKIRTSKWFLPRDTPTVRCPVCSPVHK
jgi:hypothetical protein